MPENKKCSKCQQIKNLDDFHKNASTKDGLDYICKTCKLERQRKSRLKKKGEVESGSDGRNKKKYTRQKIESNPNITEGITLDAQLLRAVKKSAVLDFVKNDLPKMVEERFA